MNMLSLTNFKASVLKTRKILFPIFAIAVLAGCEMGMQSGDTHSQQVQRSADYWLKQIFVTQSEYDKNTYRLLAIGALLDEEKIDRARSMMKELSGKKLDKQQYFNYQLLKARVLAKMGKVTMAQKILGRIDIRNVSTDDLKNFYYAQAQVALSDNDLENALRSYIKRRDYLNKFEYQSNNDAIWEVLVNADQNKLNKIVAYANEYELLGWLDLIKSYKDALRNRESIKDAVQNWRDSNYSHIANRFLPLALKRIDEEALQKSSNIALILPLSGNTKEIGNIIRLGFNYANRNNNTQIQLYDSNSNSLSAIINQAKKRGATSIVGPLVKSQVEKLKNVGLLGLNVVALNVPYKNNFDQSVCYFGLSPEEESKSGASKMFNDGVVEPLVIAPDNSFGKRRSQAFMEKWQELTGNNVEVYYYGVDEDLLKIGETLKVLPRIGKKSIYFVGQKPEEVRATKGSLNQIRELSRIKIYTTSRSNSSNNNADYRAGMDGVKFSEIPLLGDITTENYRQAKAAAKGDVSFMRLFALGYDAYTILENYRPFKQLQGSVIDGLTGKLSADENCVIERDLDWFTYKNQELVYENTKKRAIQRKKLKEFRSNKREQIKEQSQYDNQVPVDLSEQYKGGTRTF
ncbi:MAG: hypothetical protein CR960_00215 [Pasteurellales bacterium]|nr:MAG: hypothetical protein CR960_00215 [Pasteurellales bacterium]